MNALTSFPNSTSPSVHAGAAPAPASPPLVAGAGAAGPTPAPCQPGLPHPLFTSAPTLATGEAHPLFTNAWTDALTLRAAHHAHGHTPERDDATGPCLIAERAMTRLIMAIDTLRGEPSTLPARLCPRTRAVTQRRLANAMALIAAAHDAISRLPDRA